MITVWVMPYRIYLLQKIQDVFDGALPSDQAVMSDLLDQTGLSELLTLRTSRRIERRNHLEVWAG